MTWKGAKGPKVVSYVKKAGESKIGFLMPSNGPFGHKRPPSGKNLKINIGFKNHR